MTCWRGALQRSGMETPKQLFDTRVNVFLGGGLAFTDGFRDEAFGRLGPSAGRYRGGYRDATGGAWPDPDSASRWHGARWEISYTACTCVICRPHVCLHAMGIVTRQVAPHVAGFRPGRHAHDGFSPRCRADAPRLADGRSPEGKREAAEALRLAGSPSRADRGRAPRTVASSRNRGAWPPERPGPASAERTSIAASSRAARERVEDADATRWPARFRARPTGSSDATRVGQLGWVSQLTHGITAGLARDVAPSIPNRPALRWIARGGGVAPLPP